MRAISVFSMLKCSMCVTVVVSSCALLLIIVCSSVFAFPTNDDQQVDSICIVTNATRLTQANPKIRPRSAWNALDPRETNPVRHSPVPFVVVHHTYMPGACSSSQDCEEAMRAMQRFHQQDRGWLDIGYNFAVGGDGAIYEGRGWGREGAHAPRYNDKSVGISFIGDYRTSLPSPAMLEAARQLITKGVENGHIRSDYVLLGHRQTRITECPGEALYQEIKSWPHFRENPPSNPQDFENYLSQQQQ